MVSQTEAEAGIAWQLADVRCRAGGGGGAERSYLVVIQVLLKPGPQVCRGLCESSKQTNRDLLTFRLDSKHALTANTHQLLKQ